MRHQLSHLTNAETTKSLIRTDLIAGDSASRRTGSPFWRQNLMIIEMALMKGVEPAQRCRGSSMWRNPVFLELSLMRTGLRRNPHFGKI
jgi:hypothetical protein